MLIVLVGKRAEVDQMGFLDRAREVGVNLDVVEVGNNQDRRVFERFPVGAELVIGGFEIGAPALVFPCEVIPIPNIRPAVATHRFGGTALERERLPGRVHFRWCLVADHPANVEKMLLRC